MRVRNAAVVALWVLALVGPIAAQGKVDLTGKWALEVNTEAGGTTNPTVTLKQDGAGLTGHYSSSTLGEAEIKGTVKGQAITFSLLATPAGSPSRSPTRGLWGARTA